MGLFISHSRDGSLSGDGSGNAAGICRRFCGWSRGYGDVRPGDNLMFHKALQLAKSGDVIVGNYFGTSNTAGFGGLIIDGAVRDAEDFKELKMPAFSRAVLSSGCFKDEPGEVNFPISCGGVVVMAGDIVIASADGIVVVPRADAEYVLQQTKSIFEREAKRIKEIENIYMLTDFGARAAVGLVDCKSPWSQDLNDDEKQALQRMQRDKYVSMRHVHSQAFESLVAKDIVIKETVDDHDVAALKRGLTRRYLK